MDVAAEESRHIEAVIAVRQAWAGTRPSELRQGSLFCLLSSLTLADHSKLKPGSAFNFFFFSYADIEFPISNYSYRK